MIVFIAGGSGFIGSHIANKLLYDNSIKLIVIFDNFSSGTIHHLNNLQNNSKIKVINGDIKNFELLKISMKDADLVIHLAANPDISKAVNNPEIDFWEGTYLTLNILESMRLNNVSNILYTSGSGIYGDVPGLKFSESYGPCFPISTYGASKLACEALISSYCHMFSMKGRAFRFANVVGPMQTHGVGYDFVRKLIKNPTCLTILGDGSQNKSYIYIDDVIDAMLCVNCKMDEGVVFDIYNVATDDYISVTEIASIAIKLLHLDMDDVNIDYTGGDRGWKGDVPTVLFDTSKIKKLGWFPKRNSKQAIELSIQSMYTELMDKKK